MAKVRIYSTPTCPWCIKTKEYLKAHNVEFQDVDVSTNHDAAKEMITKSGQKGVPVLDIDGKIILGYDKKKIVEALGIS